MTPNTSDQASSLFRFLLGAAAFAILILAIRMGASFWNPILLALVLAITIAPALGWLQGKGLPAWLALLIVVLLVIVLLVALVLVLGAGINALVQTIPTYQANVAEQKAVLEAWLADRGIDTSNILSLNVFNPEKLFAVAGAALGEVLDGLSSAVFVLLVTAFLLAQAAGFSGRLHSPRLEADHPVLVRAAELNQQIRAYMSITTYAGVFVGAINAVFLLILGVDFPVLWGILSWLLSYIPTLGFWLAMIPPLLLALLEFGWLKALIVFVGYVLINFLGDNILKPKLFGEELNMAPVITIVSLFFWVWVLGGVGALLAIPLTLAVNKLILESSEETRWLVDLVGSVGSDQAAANTDERTDAQDASA